MRFPRKVSEIRTLFFVFGSKPQKNAVLPGSKFAYKKGMLWSDYLALISWQSHQVAWKDFVRLENESVKTPEELASFVSSPETKEYLTRNKLWWKQAEADYKLCQRKNYQLIYPGKPGYPEQFVPLCNNAPVLSVLGTWPVNPPGPRVTFVGSRIGDEIALRWMDFYLPQIIKEKRVLTVSGGARGIDQKAHAVSARAESPTLCFLPSGLDCFYPASLKTLKTGVLDNGGAFVSCFPAGFEMRKFCFYVRNGLMALYSSLVFVLQAQIRSGSMLTAKRALEYGVPVATLPGPPLSARWTGNLQLIYDGAFLIRDSADLSVLLESLSIKTQPLA